MGSPNVNAPEYEDALVQVIRIFAARGRALREARERTNQDETGHSAEMTGTTNDGEPVISSQSAPSLDDNHQIPCIEP